MMKKLLVLVAALLLLAASVQAQVVFSEDWETGTDGWTPYSATPAAISNEQNATPDGAWSMKTIGTTTSYINAIDMNWATPVTGTGWEVSWKFYDTGATREFVQIRSYSGGGGSGTLQQLIAFGCYNTATAPNVYIGGNYQLRVAVGGYQWASSSIVKTNNVWHDMKVRQTATGELTFWVDNVIAAETTTTAIYGITSIRVGSGLGNNGKGAYYDDIVVTNVVPEPSSMVALATGLVSLAGFSIRRRK